MWASVDESRRHQSLKRRTVLQGVGGAAVAWTAITVSTERTAAHDDDAGGESGGNEPRGMLVLIYDDSPREDYTKAFPVHQEYGVPGCAAVCPELMGSSPRWMHAGHLEEMYDAGWEVMGHEMMHRSLGKIPVMSDIEEGDQEIHVQSNVHGRVEGDPLLIFNEEHATTATVAGDTTDDDDQLLVLEEPIDASFEARDGQYTWVRYTDEFTHQQLERTKAAIEEWGFGPVTAWVHPFNRADGYVTEAVREYYDAVPNRHGQGLNSEFETDPYELGRENFEDSEMEEVYLEDFLDVVATEPYFGILYAHSNREEFTQERIGNTIEMAHDRGIAIVTLQEALTELGVFEEETGGLVDDLVPWKDDTTPAEGLVGRIGAGLRRFFRGLRGVFPI